MDTATETAKMVNKCPSTVQHIIERYRNENRVQNKSRLAPNRIFNEREKNMDFNRGTYQIIQKKVRQSCAPR